MQYCNLNSQDDLNIMYISRVIFLTNTLMVLNSNFSIVIFLRVMDFRYSTLLVMELKDHKFNSLSPTAP